MGLFIEHRFAVLIILVAVYFIKILQTCIDGMMVNSDSDEKGDGDLQIAAVASEDRVGEMETQILINNRTVTD